MNRAASWIQLKTSERGTTTSARPLGLAADPPALEQGQHLDRLAQAHVVGQEPPKPNSLEVVEPAQALALVGAQLAVEARRRRRAARPPRTGAAFSRTLLEGRVDLDLGLRGQQGVEQAGLRRAEPEVAVLRRAQVGEHAVLLEPLLGQHADRAVAQRRPWSRRAGRPRAGRAGCTLWPPKSTPPSSSNQSMPVVTASLNSPAGRIQLPLGLDPPARLDQVLGHLRHPLGRQLERAGLEPRVLGLAEAQLEELDVGRRLGPGVAADDQAAARSRRPAAWSGRPGSPRRRSRTRARPGACRPPGPSSAGGSAGSGRAAAWRRSPRAAATRRARTAATRVSARIRPEHQVLLGLDEGDLLLVAEPERSRA